MVILEKLTGEFATEYTAIYGLIVASVLAVIYGAILLAQEWKQELAGLSLFGPRRMFFGYDLPKSGRVDSSAGSIGAASELIVATDLLRLGFEVYRSVSPQAGCDLLVVKPDAKKGSVYGKTFRVEVKTGHRSGLNNDRLNISGKPDKAKYDVLAVVVNKEVVYSPDILQ